MVLSPHSGVAVKEEGQYTGNIPATALLKYGVQYVVFENFTNSDKKTPTHLQQIKNLEAVGITCSYTPLAAEKPVVTVANLIRDSIDEKPSIKMSQGPFLVKTPLPKRNPTGLST
jgi:hypothetical protein